MNTVPAAQTVNEDATLTFNSTNGNLISISDSTDTGQSGATNNLSTTVSVAHGTLTAVTSGSATIGNNGTTSVTLSGTAAEVNAALAGLTYAPTGNYNGSDTLTIVTSDLGNTGGGALTDTDTVAITVTSVNDAPAGADKTITTAEDSTYVLTAADFGFSDTTDGGSNAGADALSTVKISSLPAAGELRYNGTAITQEQVTAGYEVSAADLAANKLVFVPVANANGTGYANFSFQVRDNGGTTNGGLDLDASANTITFNVTAVNDAPVALLSSATLASVAEDTANPSGNTVANLFGGNSIFSDATDTSGGSTADTLAGIAVVGYTADASKGSWQYSTDNGSNWSAVGSVSDSSALTLAATAKLRFVPAANCNGSSTDLSVRLIDSSTTVGNGTRGLDVSVNGNTTAISTRTMTLATTITAVNDAPTGTNTTIGTNEDTAYALTVSDFGFGDAGDSPADQLAAVKISTLPQAGVLRYNGTAITQAQVTGDCEVSAADIGAGKLVFAPVANANGANYGSFTFQVRDNGGTVNGGIDLDQSPNTITIDVAAMNDAPLGVNDAKTTVEAGGVSNATATPLTYGNVLSNDTDVDSGDTKTVTAVSGAAAGSVGGSTAGTYGSLELLSDGTYIYALDNSLAAVEALRGSSNTLTDTFTYTVSDAASATGTAMLTVTIQGRNDAPVAVADTGIATEKGGTANATAGSNATGNVLTNDTDADGVANGETKAVTVGTGSRTGTYGTLTLNADGSYTYVVDETNTTVQALRTSGQVVSEAFSYTMADAAAVASSSSLTITIQGANDAPVGVDDMASATEAGGVANGTAGSVGSGNVLTNDTDVDSGGETKAVIAIRTGSEAGSGTSGTLGAGLAGSYGTLTVAADGTYTYVVDESNATVQALRTSGDTLTDTFTYTARDAAGATDTAALVVTIHGANDTSVMVADSKSVAEDAAATGNVLTNDSDVDDTLSVASLQVAGDATVYTFAQTATITGKGTITIAANGAYTFTPVADWNGSAPTITYTTNTGSSSTLGITVTAVNDAPAGADKTISTNEDTAYTLTAGDFGFGDVSDSPANELGAVKISSLPVAGELRYNGTAITAGQVSAGYEVSTADIGSGKLVYAPVGNANGAGYASFTFQVRDDGGTANGGVNLDASANTITIDVMAVNDAPVAVADVGAVDEDATLSVTATNGLIQKAPGADTDVDNTTASLVVSGAVAGTGSVTQSVGVGTSLAGTYGHLTLAADGSYSYVADSANALATGVTANDVFTYSVKDTGGLVSNAATLTITVTGTDDASVMVADSKTVAEDNAATGSVLANDSDVDNTLCVASFTVVGVAGTYSAGDTATIAGKGTITIAANGDYTFTPLENWNGAVTQISYTVNTGSSSTLDITVSPVNDVPLSTNDAVTVLEDVATTLSLADFGTYSDVEGSAIAGVQITTLESVGKLECSSDGTNWADVTLNQAFSAVDISAGRLRYTGGANANGTDYATIGFKVYDGTAYSASAYTLTLSVTAVNDAPAGADKTITTAEDTSYTLTAVDFGFSDANDAGHSLSRVKITTLPTASTLTLDGTAVTAGAFVSVADITGGKLVYAPAANANGTAYASFTFQVEDSGGTANGGVNLDQSANTITFNVAAVNDAPVASGSATLVAVAEDTASPNGATVSSLFSGNFGDETDAVTNGSSANTLAGIALVGYSADSAKGAWQYSTDSGSNWSTVGTVSDASGLTLTTASKLRFVPTGDYNGSSTNLSVRLIDSSGSVGNGASGVDVSTNGNTTAISAGTVTLSTTIAAVADIVADTASTAEDTAVTTSVLGNDSFENLGRTISAVSNGTHGTVEIVDASVGTVKYTPSADWHGTDSYSYTVSSGGVTETATVSVTVAAVVDVTTDTLSTAEDTAITANVITGTGGATGDNFEGTPSLSAVTQGTHGAVSFTAAGAVTYTPSADYNGADSFTYTVTSPAGVTETATVNVTVTAVDDASLLLPDSKIVAEDANASGNVLTNDSDADSVLAVANFKVLGDATAYMAGQTASIAGVGTLTIAANGDYTFTPVSDWSGSVPEATYTVNTGATSTLGILLTPVDDASVLAADSNTVAEEVVATGNVLANDSDVDNALAVASFRVAGDAATYTAGQSATIVGKGTLMIAANGDYSFTPLGNWNGSVPAVTYTVNTGSTSTLGIVVTAVNSAPLALADSGALAENATIEVTTANGVIFSGSAAAGVDTDADGDSLRVVGVKAGAATSAAAVGSGNVASPIAGTYGHLTLNADGSYRYAADTAAADSLAQGAGAVDTFSYAISDGNGGTSFTTLTISVSGANDAPVAVADDGAVAAGATLTAAAAQGVLANDTDADAGDTKAVTQFAQGGAPASVGAMPGSISSSYGTLTLAADGSYSYVADGAASKALSSGESATDRYTYTMRDAAGATSSRTLTLSITGAKTPVQPLPLPLPLPPAAKPPVAPDVTLASDSGKSVSASTGAKSGGNAEGSATGAAAGASVAGEAAGRLSLRAGLPLAAIDQGAQAAAGESRQLQSTDRGFPVERAQAAGTATVQDQQKGGERLFVYNGIKSTTTEVGQSIDFRVPKDAFGHTNKAAVVQLEASLADGSPLPEWMDFDPTSGTFSGRPPANAKGVIEVRVTARDDQGREVSSNFRMQIEGRAQADKRAAAPAAEALGEYFPVDEAVQAEGKPQPAKRGRVPFSDQLRLSRHDPLLERILSRQQVHPRAPGAAPKLLG